MKLGKWWRRRKQESADNVTVVSPQTYDRMTAHEDEPPNRNLRQAAQRAQATVRPAPRPPVRPHPTSSSPAPYVAPVWDSGSSSSHGSSSDSGCSSSSDSGSSSCGSGGGCD